MKRRDFIQKGLPAAAGAAMIGCGSGTTGEAAAVQTRPNLMWRLVSTFPRSLDTIYGAAEVFSRRVEALTGGRFKIRVFPVGEIVPFDQVLDSVQKGTVHMGHAASYYFTGMNPALAFDCTVPFGMNQRQLNAWFYHGEGLELTRAMFADFNIVNFPGGNTGTQMGGWFRNEIGGLPDLRGLKMRIPGLGGRVMDTMGVTVQVLAGGDIYPALERGAIDATEWSGPYDDEKLGFYQVARHYYYPGWWEPGPNLSFYVNKTAWETLPSEYQDAVACAAAEANVDMMAHYDANNPPALQRLLAEGVQLHRFSDDIMVEAERTTRALLEEAASADPAYDRMYRSYVAFRDVSSRWLRTAELSLSEFNARLAG